MFTGIVDHYGQVVEVEPNPKSFKITISTDFQDLTLGESIAVDGVCLTVTSHTKNTFTVDVSPETMRLTTASTYKKGVKVNLERPLRMMDRMGGHFVTGHVDGLSRVNKITTHEEFTEILFDGISPEFKKFLVSKGSIALNGVSLTLNEIVDNGFKVMLIPHTLQKTNLSDLKIGDKVNIEFDYLAKLVLNQISSEKV